MVSGRRKPAMGKKFFGRFKSWHNNKKTTNKKNKKNEDSLIRGITIYDSTLTAQGAEHTGVINEEESIEVYQAEEETIEVHQESIEAGLDPIDEESIEAGLHPMESTDEAMEKRPVDIFTEKDFAAAAATTSTTAMPMPSILRKSNKTTTPNPITPTDFHEPFVVKSDHAQLVRFMSHRPNKESGFEVLLEDFDEFSKEDVDSVEQLIADADKIANDKREETREGDPMDETSEAAPIDDAVIPAQLSMRSHKSTTSSRWSRLLPPVMSKKSQDLAGDHDKPETIEIRKTDSGLSKRSAVSRMSMGSEASVGSVKSTASSKKSRASIQLISAVKVGVEPEENATESSGGGKEHQELSTIPNASMQTNESSASNRTNKSSASKKSSAFKKSTSIVEKAADPTEEDEPAVDHAPDLLSGGEEEFITKPSSSMVSNKTSATEKSTTSKESSKKSTTSKASSKKSTLSKEPQASVFEKTADTAEEAEPAVDHAPDLLPGVEEEFITKPSTSMVSNKTSVTEKSTASKESSKKSTTSKASSNKSTLSKKSTTSKASSKKSTLSNKSRASTIDKTAETADKAEPVVDQAPDTLPGEDEFISKPSTSMVSNKTSASGKSTTSKASSKKSRDSQISETKEGTVEDGPREVAPVASGGEEEHLESVTKPSLSMVSSKSSASKKSHASLIEKTKKTTGEEKPVMDFVELARLEEKPSEINLMSTKSDASKIFSKKSHDSVASELVDGAKEEPQDFNAEPSVSMVSNKSSASKKSTFSKNSQSSNKSSLSKKSASSKKSLSHVSFDDEHQEVAEQEPTVNSPACLEGEEEHHRDVIPSQSSLRSPSSRDSRVSKKSSKSMQEGGGKQDDTFEIPTVDSRLSNKSGRSKASDARPLQTEGSITTMEEQIVKTTAHVAKNELPEHTPSDVIPHNDNEVPQQHHVEVANE